MRNEKLIYQLIAVGVSLVLVLILSLVLNTGSGAAEFLLDKSCATVVNAKDASPCQESRLESRFIYPLTIQNVMWVLFFLGLAELGYRRQEAGVSYKTLKVSYLSEDQPELRIQPEDVAPIWREARKAIEDEAAILPRLIHGAAGQFLTSRSINQANTLLNTQMDLISSAVDSKYSMIRFYMWILPTLGFIGTVYGLILSLSVVAGVDRDKLESEIMNVFPDMLSGIGVAFNTTMLGLIMSAIIVLVMHKVQAFEEDTLIAAGQRCLDHFINKLYVKA